eukprot:m.42691 g.42691  ORF g.42691 m.42691 type:complete len:72 (+) comp19186_c0_seq1:447-662(+)
MVCFNDPIWFWLPPLLLIICCLIVFAVVSIIIKSRKNGQVAATPTTQRPFQTSQTEISQSKSMQEHEKFVM